MPDIRARGIACGYWRPLVEVAAGSGPSSGKRMWKPQAARLMASGMN